MGCDGGTIPRRNELVRTKKKKETTDKDAEIAAKWKYCAISSKELIAPIVSCELGRLYNKDAVIEYLLNKESPNFLMLSHIRNLKDVVTLKLKLKDNVSNNEGYKFVCPVVGLEMNGKYRFFYIRTCGCVISERAIKEVKSQQCLVCNKPYTQNDQIIINGDEAEVEILKERMIQRRKSKEEKMKRKRKMDFEEEEKSEKGKIKSNSQLTSQESNVKTSSLTALSAKASKDYSINKDPNASEVYKSLFTTHETAKNRPKAHWVTFNPCYN